MRRHPVSLSQPGIATFPQCPQERFREKRVLLVGSKDTAEVAESYGFDVGSMAAA